jgi:hypothetical protein
VGATLIIRGAHAEARNNPIGLKTADSARNQFVLTFFPSSAFSIGAAHSAPWNFLRYAMYP